MYITRILFIQIGFFLTIISCNKKENSVTDYLNTGKVILFDNVKYNLAWSSNPSAGYYKQEYLPEKDTIDKFKKLILLEVMSGMTQLKATVDSKVTELKKRKETDPVVNYELFEKDGEIMLDFILSQSVPGQADIVERNVYRYKSFTDKNGKEGILLFGVSERAYGDDIDNFLVTLKGSRFDVPNAVSAFSIPEIIISK